jgi:hypothetical protein
MESSMFDWVEVRAKAYHEAGHIVVAVVQKLNLAEGGMRIDAGAEGVARICIRLPGDQIQREKSIIVLFAGKIAQLRFDAYNDDPQRWEIDYVSINQLVEEMKVPNDQSIKELLHKESEELVNQHWQLIRDLAETLLGRPSSSMTAEDDATGLYKGFGNPQKCLSSEEICEFFRARGIQCGISGGCSF